MKTLKINEIINETIVMFYKRNLIDNGYSLSHFKKSYVKKLKELEKNHNDAKDRIKYMIKYFKEIREEFPYLAVAKLSFPHPDLFFNNEVWEYVRSLIPKQKITFKIYSELIPELIEAISSNNIDIKSYLERGYEKRRLFGTIIEVYRLLRRQPDETLKEIYNYLRDS